MKCLICGRAGLPGAKLCADCSSARKRAFAATVTQPLLAAAARGGRPLLRPSQSIAATARRSAERGLTSRPVDAALPEPSRARRLDRAFLGAAIAGVTLLAAFIGYHRLNERSADAPQVAEVPPAPARTPVAPSMVPAGLAPKSVAQTSIPEHASTPSEPVAKPEPSKRINRAKPPIPDAVPPGPDPAPQVIYAIAPKAVPAPVVQVPTPVDPMQQMREALARCATGGLFDRIVCDQRIRREYCDGRWGTVPQCPSGVSNDHGQ